LKKIPVCKEATLLDPGSEGKWPLVLFSHGLGGTRATYSHFCCALAAEGHVVIAMEHRDGTGPFIIRDGVPLFYTRVESLIMKDASKFGFRAEQLEFRRAEVYEAHSRFSMLINGQESDLKTISGQEFNFESWLGRVRCNEKVILAGHSFGAATLLSLLSSSPPNNYSLLPVSHALALDPWLEPLLLEGQLPPCREDIPICVINSEAFTVWKEHFPIVEQAIKDWPASKKILLTIVRSQHATFSDIPLLIPFFSGRSQRLLDIINNLSISFVTDGDLATFITKDFHLEKTVNGKGKEVARIIGDDGDIILHSSS